MIDLPASISLGIIMSTTIISVGLIVTAWKVHCWLTPIRNSLNRIEKKLGTDENES
jgi:hypothetical protein